MLLSRFHKLKTLSLVVSCGLLGLPAIGLGLALSQSAHAQQEASAMVQIAAGPLSEAINQFAQQVGVAVVMDESRLSGLRTSGLQGRYDVEAGFRLLLQGSGYMARKTPEGYVIAAAPQAGAGQALPAVKVVADSVDGAPPEPYAGGQVARGGRLGLLGDTDILDAPFSITSYTVQTIEDQQARSVIDVLANEPAVRAASARTNINEDFTLRGFPVASQDIALNGMYGLMPYFRVPIDMAERVEVLKGPSALLSGMPPSGNIGGAINVVPKRAEVEPLTRITAHYLSDSVFGAHIDAGRRFGEDDAFGVRFNGMYRGGDTTVDYQSEEDSQATLGLDYRGERLRLSADVIYQKQKIDGVVRQFSVGQGVTDLPGAPDGDLSYPGAWGDLEMEDSSGVVRAEYDVSGAVTVYAGAGARRSRMDALTANPELTDNAGNYQYAPAWQLFDVDSSSFEAGLNSAFTTGAVSHQLTVSATRVVQDSDIFFYTEFAPRTGSIAASDKSPNPGLAGIDVDKNRMSGVTLTSYAVADTLGFLDDRVRLTLGARRQRVEIQNYDFVTDQRAGPGYDERELTPVAGLVVKPWSGVSFYASYVEGLSQGPTAPNDPTLNNPGEVFGPAVSEQTEVGVKVDWGLFGGSFALYQLEQPVGIRIGNTFDVSGEQRHRGAELNLFGQLLPSVRLLGGAAWIDSELTKTESGVNQGSTAVGVPELQINVGAEWDTPQVPGLTLSARAIYTDEQYVDAANDLQVPDWTRVDIGARYHTHALGRPVVLRVNVENVFNETYWGVSSTGYLHVGEARNVMLSATVDF